MKAIDPVSKDAKDSKIWYYNRINDVKYMK